MILNKEKGKRMWGGDGGSGGSGGSGFDPSTLAGFAQQSWVNNNFVSKSFFNQMFELQYSQRVLTKDGDTVINDETTDMVATPNTFIDTTTQTRYDEETGYTIETTNTITGIKAKTGLWTPSYLSALGQNTSGGGGGGSLNEPLLSINTSGLSAPGASQNGMTIVWDNATQKWKYGSAGGGGGVTSITAGTGLSGGTITGSGTIAINSTYQTYIGHGETAYGWGNHASAGYATQTWVGQQGFLTQTAADSRYISISFFARLFQAKNGSANVNPNDTTSTIDSIKALFGFWTDQYISALGQNSGGGGGGVSLNEPLSSINTSNMIAPTAAQNGMTIVWDNAASKWKYGAVGSSYTLPLAANGTRGGIQIGFTTDGANRNYAVLLSGEKAYVNVPWTDTDTWRPVQDNLTSTSTSDSLSANQGRVLKGYIDTLNGYFTNGSAKTALKLTTARTIWGQTFDGSANITGTLYDVVSIVMTGSISGTQGIEMNTNGALAGYGGFIDFHYGGSDVDYSSRIIEEESGRITIQSRATVADPTKGISKGDAIPSGLIISGGHNESYLQIGDIRLIYDQKNNAIKAEKFNGQAANFYATGGVSALGVPTSGSGTVDTLNVNTLKTVNNLYIGDNSNSIYYDYDDDTLFIQSGSGDIALKGSLTMRGINATQRSINTQGGNLSLGGGYIYLTSGVYLFFESNNVKVSINGTPYTLNKS